MLTDAPPTYGTTWSGGIRTCEDGLTLNAYFDSKKDLHDWKTRNEEVLDNLTPTKGGQAYPIRQGKISKAKGNSTMPKRKKCAIMFVSKSRKKMIR